MQLRGERSDDGPRGIFDTQQGSQIPFEQHIPGQGPRGHPKGAQLTLHTSGSGFLNRKERISRFVNILLSKALFSRIFYLMNP